MSEQEQLNSLQCRLTRPPPNSCVPKDGQNWEFQHDARQSPAAPTSRHPRHVERQNYYFNT